MPNIGRLLVSVIIAVLFSFICLFAFTKLFGPIPFHVQNVTTTKETLFSVDGMGEVTVIPDTVMISLGVSKTAANVQAAQTQVNTIVNQITEDLKNLGINVKDIKTTNYSVNPQYDYSRGTQTITGYIVETNLQVKIQPIDRANDAIDLSTKAGANQIGSILFTVDDEKKKELQEEARMKAIGEAKVKAESLARAAGIRLGRIVDVRESSQDYYPYPVDMRITNEKASEGDIATELNPGENKITSSVTLSYETF